MLTDTTVVRGRMPGNTLPWLRKAAREPLVHFMLAGLLISVGVGCWNAYQARHTIEITSTDEQRIADKYRQQFGRAPTPQQLGELTDRYIREEIVVREAAALHLDQQDEVIRRRLAQKYEFLRMDLAAPAAPDDAILSRWFEARKQRYLLPQRVSFEHLYFSADTHGLEAAKARALLALGRLHAMHAARATHLGDAFPGPAAARDLSPAAAARIFGESELSENVFTLPVGPWTGPYRSGYGWHLVRVTEHLAATMPTLAAIRAQVLADYLDEQRSEAQARHFEKLRAQYNVRHLATDR